MMFAIIFTLNGEWWMDLLLRTKFKMLNVECKHTKTFQIHKFKSNERKNWNGSEWLDLERMMYGKRYAILFSTLKKNSSNFPISNFKWAYIERSFISVWIFDANICRTFVQWTIFPEFEYIWNFRFYSFGSRALFNVFFLCLGQMFSDELCLHISLTDSHTQMKWAYVHWSWKYTWN